MSSCFAHYQTSEQAVEWHVDLLKSGCSTRAISSFWYVSFYINQDSRWYLQSSMYFYKPNWLMKCRPHFIWRVVSTEKSSQICTLTRTSEEVDGTLLKISFLKLRVKGVPNTPCGHMGVDGMDLLHKKFTSFEWRVKKDLNLPELGF